MGSVLIIELGYAGYLEKRRADDLVKGYFPMDRRGRANANGEERTGLGSDRHGGVDAGEGRRRKGVGASVVGPTAAAVSAGAGRGGDADDDTRLGSGSGQRSKDNLRGVQVARAGVDSQRPGEGYIIFSNSAEDELPEMYLRVLQRGARWTGVEACELLGCVVRMERRIHRGLG